MSNDPKADLIYAILTMDSYNRGYGSGISNLDVSTNTDTLKLGACGYGDVVDGALLRV
jgi:hypothetical protein